MLLSAVALYVFVSAYPSDLHLIRRNDTTQWLTWQQVQELAEATHRDGHCGGFMDITTHPQGRHWLQDQHLAPGQRPSREAIVKQTLQTLSATNIMHTVRELSSLHDRYYNGDGGEAGAAWISAAFQDAAVGRADIEIEQFEHAFRQPTVIVRMKGHGAKAAEKVILGAHQDSINWETDSLSPHPGRAPGADDNASGIAVLLEVFRALAKSDYKPSRTVEFMAYAGEELGLLGSQDVAEAYRAKDAKVAGVLQMDMTMYPARTHKITLVTDHTSRKLTDFTERLIDTYVKVAYQETRCGYACSDHASWDYEGYPAVFPFESGFSESNPYIHTARDSIEHLDSDFGLQFARLNTAFAMEMAE